MLSVQNFLKLRSFEDLKTDPFNLMVNEKDDLVVLKYNQIKSDFTIKLVKECRGLILNKDTHEVVCHPFNKFFNLGESFAFNIDFKMSKVFEKADGSIIKVYFYDGEWRVATNGTIDAVDAELTEGLTFDKLFFDVISKEDFKLMTSKFYVSRTYLFELIHPAAQIVVDYDGKKELVFIGMKENNVIDSEVIDYNIFDKEIKTEYDKVFKKFPVRFPKVFSVRDNDDINELVNIADELNVEGNSMEGFVVAQVEGNRIVGRVKIKSPKYLVLHRVATGDGVTNNLIKVLVENEMDEFEAYVEKLPESVRNEYDELKEKYFKLNTYLYERGEYYRNKSKNVIRKDLALDIQKQMQPSYIGIMFTMVDNEELDIRDLLKALGMKKVKHLLTLR